MNELEKMKSESRIWIFQADRWLLSDEISTIELHFRNFLKKWQAHGKQLSATAKVLNEIHVVIALDEDQASATGCSIDSMTNEIKKLGQQLNVDFFNRTNTVLKSPAGDLKLLSFQELKQEIKSGTVDSNSFVFDNTVSTVSQIDNGWLKPISKSWQKRLIKQPS